MLRQRHVRLNMIVKNEALVIEDALASSLGIIDSFCIVDTGSGDKTIEVIQAWSHKSQITGHLHQRPWKNFGDNRTQALDLAVADGVATHILFLDADDRFKLAPQFDKNQIAVGQSYHVNNKSGTLDYALPGLISVTDKRWCWKEPLHEYLEPIGHSPHYLPLAYMTVLKNTVKGGRSLGVTQREKYLRDAAILKDALLTDPDNPRSMYYLANSYRDAGEQEMALAAYQKRAGHPGWDQETYDAMMQAGLCLERLDRIAEALLQLQRAWEFRKTRRDAVYHCVRILRRMDCHGLARHFGTLAYEIDPVTTDILFVDKSASSWKLDDEVAVAAYWLADYQHALDLSLRALGTATIPQKDRHRITANAVFAKDKLLEKSRGPTQELRQSFAVQPPSGQQTPTLTLTVTSCKRPDLFRRTVNSFLNCCLDAKRVTRWICVDDGSDPADLADLATEFPFMEFHTGTVTGGTGHTFSMNYILGLLNEGLWIHLEDDWEFIYEDSYISRAIDVFDGFPDVAQILFNLNYGEDIIDSDLVGGFSNRDHKDREFWIHQHINPSSEAYNDFLNQYPAGTLSNVWWPHYSLRPSILRVSEVKSIGTFAEKHSNFELDFATRYTAAGLRTAFLYRLACLHIGKKIRDADENKKSAYELNNVSRYIECQRQSK